LVLEEEGTVGAEDEAEVFVVAGVLALVVHLVIVFALIVEQWYLIDLHHRVFKQNALIVILA